MSDCVCDQKAQTCAYAAYICYVCESPRDVMILIFRYISYQTQILQQESIIHWINLVILEGGPQISLEALA